MAALGLWRGTLRTIAQKIVQRSKQKSRDNKIMSRDNFGGPGLKMFRTTDLEYSFYFSKLKYYNHIILVYR